MGRAAPILLTLVLLLFWGCKKAINYSVSSGITAVIDLGSVQQTIRGFGGSSAWMAMTDAEMNTLYGNDSSRQLGLSILRIRIDPAGASKWGEELSNAQKAISHGAIVMATPWSPPASMKTNNSTLNGGKLDTSSYAAYSAYLASFAAYMAANGAPLYALSVQNEPEFAATYESCVWAPADLFNFVRNYPPAMGNTKLMASESLRFNHDYTDPILNDSVAAAHLAIAAGHIYGSGLAPYPLATGAGKEVWMTEHLNFDTSWAGALSTAKEINDCLATGGFNVYNYWWLKKSWGLIDSLDNTTKRGYVMGQFAKYIRPGYQHVTATYSPCYNVYISAYKDGTKVVVIAINMGSSFVSQPFQVSGAAIPPSFTPHVTSASLNISTEPVVHVSAGTFTCYLPAQSITTLVSD